MEVLLLSPGWLTTHCIATAAFEHIITFLPEPLRSGITGKLWLLLLLFFLSFFSFDSLTMEHWSQTAVSHMLHLYAFALSLAPLPPPPPLDNFVKSVLFHEFKATLWPQNNLMYCSIMFEFWLMNSYIFKLMYFPYVKNLHVEETRYI